MSQSVSQLVSLDFGQLAAYTDLPKLLIIDITPETNISILLGLSLGATRNKQIGQGAKHLFPFTLTQIIGQGENSIS